MTRRPISEKQTPRTRVTTRGHLHYVVAVIYNGQSIRPYFFIPAHDLVVSLRNATSVFSKFWMEMSLGYSAGASRGGHSETIA